MIISSRYPQHRETQYKALVTKCMMEYVTAFFTSVVRIILRIYTVMFLNRV